MTAITRPADPADVNFILNSFLKSLRGYPAFEYVPNEIYYPAQKRILESHLRASQPIVLCNSEFPDQIFGYVLGVPNECTHFVYVKYPYRQFGFAKQLLEAMHPQLYTKTLKATYICRNWPALTNKFNHIHCPFVSAA